MIQYDFVEEALMEDYEIYKVYRGPFLFFNECSAIFYKKERFKLIDSQSFWLSRNARPNKRGLGRVHAQNMLDGYFGRQK